MPTVAELISGVALDYNSPVAITERVLKYAQDNPTLDNLTTAQNQIDSIDPALSFSYNFQGRFNAISYAAYKADKGLVKSNDLLNTGYREAYTSDMAEQNIFVTPQALDRAQSGYDSIRSSLIAQNPPASGQYSEWRESETATPGAPSIFNPKTNKYETLYTITPGKSGGGGFFGGGGFLGILGAVVGIALAPATGGASLTLAGYGAVGGAVGSAIGGGDPIKGALIGGALGFGAGALGAGGAAAGEVSAATAASEAAGGSFAGTAGSMMAPEAAMSQLTGGALGLTETGYAAGISGAAAGTGAGLIASTMPTLPATLTESITAGALNPATAGNVGLASGLGTGAAGVTAGSVAAAPAVIPTGGVFVGTGGTSLITGSGNSIVDGALNSALSNVTKNTAGNILTGNDPFDNTVNAALGGAAFGGVSSAIAANPITIAGSPLLSESINGAMNAGLSSGAAAAVTGGDVGNAVIGGGLIGAGMPIVKAGVESIAPMATEAVNAIVPDAINPNIQQSTVSNVLGSTAQGALVGGVSAGVNNGDIANGAIVGGLGGLGGSLAGQTVDSLFGMGAGTVGNTIAQDIGKTAGQVIGNEIAPVNTPIQPAVDPVYNAIPLGTMSGVGSIINPSYAGGLINNYQSLASQRANAMRA